MLQDLISHILQDFTEKLKKYLGTSLKSSHETLSKKFAPLSEVFGHTLPSLKYLVTLSSGSYARNLLCFQDQRVKIAQLLKVSQFWSHEDATKSLYETLKLGK